MSIFTDILPGAELRSWLTTLLPILFLSYYLLWIIYALTLHPLAKIPGPIWPAVSRTWIIYRAWAGDLEIHHRALHARYGPLVRIAPDEVVCSDPREMGTIYPITRPLEKTPWYDAWRPGDLAGRRDMFTNRSEKDHAAYRKLIGPIYALPSILLSEPKLDTTVSLFTNRLAEFADSNTNLDFGLWLEMYAFDNIGVVFFGKQFGFLQHRFDHGGYINAVHHAMPFLHVLASAPAYARPLLMGGAVLVPGLLKAVIAIGGVKRTAVRETGEARGRAEEDTGRRVDVTSLLLGIMREKGDKGGMFGFDEIVSENWVAVMAGADSTSIALRSVFYYLMRNPEVLAKTRNEVDAAYKEGVLTSPAQHNQVIKLTYLSAVIRESFRLFSPFSASISRYSPAQGITLAGTYIPGGWRVGCNPAVVHYFKEVFGEDAASFRPERWLESNEEQVKLMQKCMMHFGAGTRRCTGQNIAMAEILKIVPEVLHRFDFEMTHNREWKTQNAGFNMQTGMTCRFVRRQVSS
ncbi:cytochrome P450 [Plenodomus tracheiphilus IPT5]|uniref:Cytochrome P450 n=1 Tax=Plenodomus tracheiphilus IPT5 TaxID=1408161 RepID=A0A6A7BBI4_9PLEO|nr:cytochrome P450 [Plenodomus tracheiphilus IPT5]